MDTARLRQETQPEHTATEDTVPLMRPGLTCTEYADALRGFYRAVRAWDTWAEAHVPNDLRALLAQRRNAGLLADDLRLLGADVPSDDEVSHAAMADTVVPGDARSVFLGRMYVMEGSTLGGQYIARHVEDTLGLEQGEGNSFFRGYGEQTGERWREFKALLEALPDAETDTVIASAKNMFRLFGQAMQSVPSRS